MLDKIVTPILLVLTFSINALVTEDWSSSFKKAINWQMITALGNYIVQTNSGLDRIVMVEGMVFLESENTFIKKYNF